MSENPPKKEIHLSKTRHLGLKIGLFVGVALICSTMLVLSLVGVLSGGTGYRLIEIALEEGITYSDGMSLYLYFEGNLYQANQASSKASKIYSQYLKEAYILTDDSHHYVGNKSVVLLNENLNEDVEVDEELYSVLKEAYDYSLVNENYSLFSEPLYDYWESLALNYNTGDIYHDPINDSEVKDYLTLLASFINDESHHHLEFKENNVVRAVISNEYASFIENNEIDSPIVSLGVLKEAYEMKIVKEKLEKEGYHKGYFINECGYGLTFSETNSIIHSIAVKKDKTDIIGETNYDLGSHSFLYYNNFNDKDPYFYSFTKENKTYLRSPHLNIISAEPNNYFSTLYIYNKDKDIVETILEGSKFLLVNNKTEEDSLVNTLNASYIFTHNNEEENNLYISKDIKEKVIISEYADYDIKPIGKE